jgi:hypothetical protein
MMVGVILSELEHIVTSTINDQTTGAFPDWGDVDQKLFEEFWACYHLMDSPPEYGNRMNDGHVAFIKAHPDQVPVHFALVDALMGIGISPFDFDLCHFFNSQRDEVPPLEIKTSCIRPTMSKHIEVKSILDQNAQALMNAAEVVRKRRTTTWW